MKATFYYEEKIVKSITLIDILDAEDMVDACNKAVDLVSNVGAEFNTNNLERLYDYKDIDDSYVEISAIVPYSG